MAHATPGTDPASSWSRAHWLVGAAGVSAFLGSGLWMHFRHAHLDGFDRATTLSFRSIHIYLMFASVLNLAAAPRVPSPTRPWTRAAMRIGSSLLLAGPALLTAAFVQEPLVADLERNLTRLGVFASAAGAALHAVVQLAGRRARSIPDHPNSG